MKKTVMIIDGGGRGSVLVEAYLKSKYVDKVIAVPGNDLMTLNKNVIIFPHIKTTDKNLILDIAKRYKVNLVDVAQDDAIAVGVTDLLQKNKIPVFGPTQKAGQIEWDKAWSRKFMKRFDIPSPLYKICRTQKEGLDYIKKQKNNKWYIKASGLVAGKGALFASNNQKAINQIKKMKLFGDAGKTYLIEECMEGEEFSSFALVNREKYKILGHAQDHKTVYENNKGANTGGMGCSSPPMVITKDIETQINDIFQKTIIGLKKEGRPFIGILYFGGIILKDGRVSTIEFNSRWGDPEAQILIPGFQNDYFTLISGVGKNKLQKIKKDKKYRVVVAAASKGYPGNYSNVTGKEIKNLNKIKVFGAGVRIDGKKFIASGGRLFYVLGEGKNVVEARKKAYNALSKVSITAKNLYYRKDIGFRDLERMQK